MSKKSIFHFGCGAATLLNKEIACHWPADLCVCYCPPPYLCQTKATTLLKENYYEGLYFKLVVVLLRHLKCVKRQIGQGLLPNLKKCTGTEM